MAVVTQKILSSLLDADCMINLKQFSSTEWSYNGCFWCIWAIPDHSDENTDCLPTTAWWWPKCLSNSALLLRWPRLKLCNLWSYVFVDHKAQYQKLNATCSFFIHKAHLIIKHITLSKTQITYDFKIRQIKLHRITVHTREFNLSHMPNPLDTNRIKVVLVFDSVCASVVNSILE